MTPSAVPARALRRALAVGVAALLTGVADLPAVALPIAEAQPSPDRVERARERLQQRLGAEGVLRADPRTGALRTLGRLDGPLTPQSNRDLATISRDFLRENATAMGLAAADPDTLQLVDRLQRPDGGEVLTWTQEVLGIPAAGATLRVVFDAKRRVRALSGNLVPSLHLDTSSPVVSAADAYRRVRGGAPAVERRGSGPERPTAFRDGGEAALTVFRAGGRDHLAWRVLAPVNSRRFDDAIVDAASGHIRQRFNRVRNERRIAHFSRHPGAPVGGGQEIEQIPVGWLPSAPGYSALTGPNVHAVLDPDDEVWVAQSGTPPFFVESGTAGAEEVPADAEHDWKAVLNRFGSGSWDQDTGDSWRLNATQSATQLFWFVNHFHDHLARAPIGFDAASGNFEGNDPIIAQAMDGANGPSGVPDPQHLNNANMLTLPDGVPGYMQAYLFGDGFPEVDGANDASLVYHEYAHGLLGRLVTYADGWDAMWAGGAGGQPGALGEGTSDWYAMDLLVADGLETDSEQEQGDVRMGEYVDGDTTLIRHQGLDCRVGVTTGCPGPADTGPGGFDFSDYGRIEGAPDVHSDGEIWAETLWDVRRALTATRPDGVTRARRYITGGLRLAPPEPTFLEMRDAILQSAALAAGGEDVGTLWQAFAGRGLGWSATTDGPLDSQPSAAFDVPPGAHTGEATSVQATAATLNGVIDPNGEPTAYRFQFGETVTYGGATALGSLGGHDPIGVATTVTGLRPGTTYHYRVVALRGVRELDGADRTFTTPPPPPPAVPAAPAAPPAAIRPTSLVGSRLTVTAKGFFKVRAIFGDSAPLGSARFTVLAGTRRLARASSPVRPGRTVTKTLRLSARGRDVIRRGRSKRVTVELRLPGGQKVKKTMRLTRRRR